MNELILTLTMSKDDGTCTYAGWFKEFPNVVGEGANEEELITNLLIGVKESLAYKAKIDEMESSLEMSQFEFTEKRIVLIRTQ